MSHRDRSIANMRCEAKRIYNQRRYINKLEKDIKELKYNWEFLRKHFNFLYLNSSEGTQEFLEDILLLMKELEKGGSHVTRK